MKTVISLSILVLWLGLAFGQQEDEEFDFPDYRQMREHFGQLYSEGKYQEAARLLEWALPQFPDNVLANSYNLALSYLQLQRYEKSVEALQYALDRDVWFNRFIFESEIWQPLTQLDGFEAVLARNEELRAEAQKTSKMELEVITPEGYEKERKYPLFIALHGGGGNIDAFRNVWISEKMGKEFITAYIQSSQIVAMDGFSWTEDIEIAKKDISSAYDAVTKEYAVDSEEVIIGGFSSGGVAALEVALCNTLPVSGFVALCPAKPESFTEANLTAAKERGLRGTLLTTEMDPRLADQKEMVAAMEKVGFEHRFVVTPDVGHWIPDDLNVMIDHSIGHIRNK
ncbi:MAG: hypothetical protein JSU65_13155 [Candidatus Zixiibacteriota bacterium]|nr:MAG: hypothetical protein JSU65_13155 [candidate division Zixibacteria bacterium]